MRSVAIELLCFILRSPRKLPFQNEKEIFDNRDASTTSIKPFSNRENSNQKLSRVAERRIQQADDAVLFVTPESIARCRVFLKNAMSRFTAIWTQRL
jgi:hypothetical protein